MFRIIALILAVAVSQARAEGYGVSYFACAAFTDRQLERALDVFEGVSDPTLTVLYGTFGNVRKCINRFDERFGSDSSKIIIHSSNETCRRFERFCAVGEVNRHLRADEYNKKLQHRKKRVLRSIKRRGNSIARLLESSSLKSQILITTGLEDNFTNRAYRQVIRQLKNSDLKFQNVSWIRNPVSATARGVSSRGADFIELHTANPSFDTRRCMYSNDGIDIDFGRRYEPLRGSKPFQQLRAIFKKFRRDCGFVSVWWNTQGIRREGPFIAPRRRTFNIRRRDVRAVNKFIKEN